MSGFRGFVGSIGGMFRLDACFDRRPASRLLVVVVVDVVILAPFRLELPLAAGKCERVDQSTLAAQQMDQLAARDDKPICAPASRPKRTGRAGPVDSNKFACAWPETSAWRRSGRWRPIKRKPLVARRCWPAESFSM